MSRTKTNLEMGRPKTCCTKVNFAYGWVRIFGEAILVP